MQNQQFQAQLQARTKQFALRVMKLCRTLDQKPGEGWVIRNQVLRSGTAVAANYRAACRARSVAEFAAKIGVVVEECDETLFWFELLIDGHVVPSSRMQPLLDEAQELLRIFASSCKTARLRTKSST